MGGGLARQRGRRSIHAPQHTTQLQASRHFPVHHTHKQDVVYQSTVVEKKRGSQEVKGRPQINKQGSGWGNGKQRHCHHQVMWGRVKELFRIPALAGMGADKGKQARGREFGRDRHGGWYNWAAACSRFTPEPHSTPLPLPLPCSTAPHLGSQHPGRRKHTHQAKMDRLDRSQHRGQV